MGLKSFLNIPGRIGHCGCITHPIRLSTCKSFLWPRNSCLCLSFLCSDACPLLLPSLSHPALLVLAGWPGSRFCSWRRLSRSLVRWLPLLLWKHREEEIMKVPQSSGLGIKPSLIKKHEDPF